LNLKFRQYFCSLRVSFCALTTVYSISPQKASKISDKDKNPCLHIRKRDI
jgi:hypothetical protein